MSKDDEIVRKSWLQEKIFVIFFTIVMFILGTAFSIIGVLMLGHLNRIDKNFDKVTITQESSNKLAREERNQIRADIAIVSHKQISGRDKIKDALGTQRVKIELNSEKIKNLEKVVYK